MMIIWPVLENTMSTETLVTILTICKLGTDATLVSLSLLAQVHTITSEQMVKQFTEILTLISRANPADLLQHLTLSTVQVIMMSTGTLMMEFALRQLESEKKISFL
jgi:hypothetical protein